MWSRREQHQAYRFLTRRIVSAVLSGEPETNELPMRRFGVALFSGVGVALLVIAGFTIFGLMYPGGGRPQENVIILERETGALYLYQSGELHSIMNWTSARLILGQAPVKNMSQASLRDIPRGAAVGIPEAPDSLPDAKALVGLPWTVCSAPRSRTGESVGLATHLIPGSVPAGGQPLAEADGLLVSTVDTGELYLLWHDQRLAIQNRSVATALGYPAQQALRVAPAFLDAMPAGPDLRVPTGVGELFHDESNDVYYAGTGNGLARIGHVTARLWQELAGAAAQPISARDADAQLDENGAVELPGLPDAVPSFRGAGDVAVACAAYRGDPDPQFAVGVEVYQRAPDDIPDVEGPAQGSRTLADRVGLPGGRGALATTLLPPGVSARGPLYLITDQGVRYPLGGSNPDSTKEMLGYANVVPIELPPLFLDLMPIGVELDPDKARNLSAPAPAGPTPSAPVAG